MYNAFIKQRQKLLVSNYQYFAISTTQSYPYRIGTSAVPISDYTHLYNT